MSDSGNLKHWYNLCFISGNGTRQIHSNVYIGLHNQAITKPIIDSQRENLEGNAVLLSVSYLGFMNSSTFEGKQNKGNE